MNTKLRRGIRNLLVALITIMICVMSFFAIINITFNFVYIRSDVYEFSMQPTLNKDVTKSGVAGDVVYFNKYSEIKRGDIVIADCWWNDRKVVKRLVGTPGDKIQIKDEGENYGLYVNDELFYLTRKTSISDHGKLGGSTAKYYDYLAYLNNSEFQETVETDEKGNKYIRLRENDYFLMGDNWAESTDSIEYGVEKRNSIYGRAEIIIYVGENRFFSMVKHMLLIVFR